MAQCHQVARRRQGPNRSERTHALLLFEVHFYACETPVPSPLETQLTDDLKAAMIARDEVAKMSIRMVKTKIIERRTAKAGVEITDEMVQDIIRGYVKMMQGSVDELLAGGAHLDEPNIAQMILEIALLDKYLPKLLDEAGTEALVDAVIATLGAVDPKQVGRITGLVMKDHKGKVDPGLVAKIVRQRLGV